MARNIVVIYGSVREQRLGIRAARFVVRQLSGRGIAATLVDPLEHRLPLLDKRYKDFEPGKAPPEMEKLHRLFSAAEGFVIVTGEYNHGVPPALKNMLDHFMPEFFLKPSGIVSYSYGSFGGVRAAVQLREIVAELGMPSISSTFPIPAVQEAFDTDGNALDKTYEQRIKRFFDEFLWYADALATARAKGTPY